MNRLRVWLLVPCTAALLNCSCKSPEPMSGPARPSSAAAAERRTPSAEATGPSALLPSTPPTVDIAPATGASAVKDAPKYPDEPCDQVASDFREFTFCWSEAVSNVRDDLDATVLGERMRATPLNSQLAALIGDQEKWERTRDIRCNAKDNGQMGQGLGSMGSLSVAHCRYEADRKRLAAFQAARDKP